MKRRLATLALVLGLALSSVSVGVAANSPTTTRGTTGNPNSSTTGGGSGGSSSSSSSGSSSSGSVGVVSNSGSSSSSFTNSQGQTYSRTVTNSNGIVFTTTKIGNFTVVEAEQTGADGTVTKYTQTGVADNQGMNNAMNLTMLVTTKNGITVGCFVNPATGLPFATGTDTVLYAYNTNGELVAHYIDANGFFFTGTRVINGQTYTFNSEGVIVG